MAHAASVFVSFLGALFYRSTFLGALCTAHSGMTMHLQSGVPCLPAVCRGLKYCTTTWGTQALLLGDVFLFGRNFWWTNNFVHHLNRDDQQNFNDWSIWKPHEAWVFFPWPTYTYVSDCITTFHQVTIPSYNNVDSDSHQKFFMGPESQQTPKS